IRELFSKLPVSKQRGYGPGRFSFNAAGGRCERCEGNGRLRIEMHFLPDAWVTCPACSGKRFNRETLEATYKGRSIAEILDLSVADALAFFRPVPKLRHILAILDDLGLGYLPHLPPDMIQHGVMNDPKTIAQFRSLTHPAHLGASFHVIEFEKSKDPTPQVMHRLALG
ncbi:MAG: hypothetical protein ACK5AA_07340, partial [Akkermansiaceae bacterium]